MIETRDRITHDIAQGTDEWIALRSGYYTASEAPAALGESKHVSRNDLIRQKATGIQPEHDHWTLALFERGHEAEAAARPIAEAIAGQDLSPIVMTATIGGLPLLASLDGLSFDGLVAWENKLWNKELAAHVSAGTLPDQYKIQMDQQLAVSGAERCLFTCTDGTPEKAVSCWYESTPERVARLVAGWQMLAQDVAAYRPETQAVKPIAQAIESLPSLRIVVTGEVTSSNLPQFKTAAMAAINSFPRELTTDQNFADAEKRVKWCAEVEEKVVAAIESIQGQNASIDDAVRTLREIASAARDERLYFSKAVTTEKGKRRMALIADAEKRLADFVAAKNVLLKNVRACPYTAPSIRADLLDSIKGLKSLDSMTGKLAAVVAQAIARATEATANLQANAEALTAADLWHLLPDFHEKGQKAPEDFNALLAQRQAQHMQAIADAASLRAEREAAERASREAAGLHAVPANEPIAPPTPAGDKMKIGDLNVLLAPAMVSAASLEVLGFTVSKAGAASVVQASDLPAICDALIAKLMRVRDSRKAA